MTEQQIIEFLIWFKKQPEIIKRALDPTTIAKMYFKEKIKN